MKFAWIRPNGTWNDRKDAIVDALESGFDHILDFDNTDTIKQLGNVSIISDKDDADIKLLGFNEKVTVADVKKEQNKGKQVAAYVEINNKEDEKLVSKLGTVADYVILKGKNWKVIPLENIIASLQDRSSKIIVDVPNYDEAKLALETMEHGSDGVLLSSNEGSEIRKLGTLIEKESKETYDLKAATVTKVEPVGIGDRVCVDTCSMMQVGEGMLIGSYATGLFLVHSETLESEYVASRPFRVNAGPVQAYVMTPGNKTRYLSELEAGDEVLTINTKGEASTAIVGRVKIEKRPLLLVEAEYEGIKIRTLLQNAETIRLVSDKQEPVSVAKLKVGDKILAFFSEGARHFGMAIEEQIIEK
ncbi:MAG: 3-dehydroquinate synthase II [Methanosphaera sp.]|jgi:3-dehydroquinate synthase II|uniref:3-dehydroquinate synthase II n=1 Tax=Methanosphaera TaxID=2316 RepID=UPI002380A75F|nr:3-dehydroquinate synthase II [Candidatus Methanosphaera massiliense]MDD6285732.1 3-dehydroquinate synthase II [Methanobacteriaceae archaeon]MDE4078048.1 3-dehydroquinate synthase II [Candidatus Methanosphaera massiliense]MDY2744997.1 3-dehydroquinate synthase II [Methanosphaera sp.]